MQYGQLISRSLSIVWRRRYLWLLAILGGADVGGGFGTSFPNPSTFRGGAPGATTAGGVGVVGVLVVLALIPAAIVIGIVFTLATRSLVLEQRGPIAALGRGLNLMGARLGRALLVWLIQVGLSIGVGIALLVVVVVVFVILGGLIFAVGYAAGQTAAIIVGIPVGLVLLAALILVSGMTNSYFSTYWTLAFRRME